MIHLIDASVFVFRAWFSIPPDMTDTDGQPVNAVYGYTGFLCDLLEQARPGHVAAAFDESLTSSFRNEIYPAYKANRELPPADLERQFQLCREVTGAMGVAHLADPRYEADDIIGTLTQTCRTAGLASTIVTRDKDLAQLLRPGDVFLNPVDRRSFQYQDVAAHFGAAPERMADFQALVGDKVDNIAGVPGIGAKTAAALFASFDSLESLYQDLEAVEALPIRGAAGVARRLREHRDAAFLARQLTRIVTDMPLDMTPADLTARTPDIDAVEALFDRLGFGQRLRLQARRLAAHH
ncbi:MAG: 5'-3' exonuclease H3TH domain-containing protein [Gammaproteobacteria bacterium]